MQNSNPNVSYEIITPGAVKVDGKYPDETMVRRTEIIAPKITEFQIKSLKDQKTALEKQEDKEEQDVTVIEARIDGVEDDIDSINDLPEPLNE